MIYILYMFQTKILLIAEINPISSLPTLTNPIVVGQIGTIKVTINLSDFSKGVSMF